MEITQSREPWNKGQCDSEGAGLAGFIASAVIERPKEEFDGVAAGIFEVGSID